MAARDTPKIPFVTNNNYIFTLGCVECFHEFYPTVNKCSFIKIIKHSCSRDILLASTHPLESDHWERIRFRCRPEKYTGKYVLCKDFIKGKECNIRDKNCRSPHTDIETNIWTLERKHKLNLSEIAVNILAKIGHFLHCCKLCYFEHKKISIQERDANECCSVRRHHWTDNCGFFFINDSTLKPQIYFIRNFRRDFILGICYRTNWHIPKRINDCIFAHSEIELNIWSLEKNNLLNKCQIEQKSMEISLNDQQYTERVNNCKEYHCDYCQKWFRLFPEFKKHFTSPDHLKYVLSDQNATQWKHRSPPICVLSGKFKLCIRNNKGLCRYNFCTYAHSEEELQEWQERLKQRREMSKKADMKNPFLKDLLKEYKEAENESKIIQEFSENVDLVVSHSGFITLNRSIPGKEEKFEWNLTVKSKDGVVLPKNVGLLLDKDRAYFHLIGNKKKCLQAFCYSSSDLARSTYTVGFSTPLLGEYEQWVIFDFGQRPVLMKKLHVTVVSESNYEINSDFNRTIIQHQPWNPLKYEIIKLESSQSDFEEFKDALTSSERKDKLLKREELTEENYHAQMTSFLHSEELACTNILLRYNTEVTLLCQKEISIESSRGTTMVVTQGDELFAKIELPAQLTDDTDGGRLILENVNTVYIKPVDVHSRKVYEAKILSGQADGKELESVTIVLNDKILSTLNLTDRSSFKVEVQFKPDRLAFCRLHYGLSKFDNPRIIFPNFSQKRRNLKVHSNTVKLFEGLNNNQLKAAQMIIREFEEDFPPFLLFGPFGTGKTFTLATIIKYLVKNPKNKILICTKSNSAADLYIREYFDYSSPKTLRIYAEERRVQTVDPIVKKYCLMTEDQLSFKNPLHSDINNNQIIISTLVNSLVLVRLGLRGSFTHIFIDEAGQALENEALMAVSMADSKSKIILAGDHNQMNPKVYSDKAIECEFNRSLLERLFYYYLATSQRTVASNPYRVVLTENYRTRKEILEFLSNLYYTRKELKLIAGTEQPKHPEMYPMVFYSTKGHETIIGTSYQNKAEAEEIADRVKELIDTWPFNVWEQTPQAEIGVLAPYASQVNIIRILLRKMKLSKVTVERVANVQGKQFRAIFISTVRTPNLDDVSTTSNLGFLTDPKLLNTAFTRAKSLVVVVGSVDHLCSIGECSGAWINFIHECKDHQSLFPHDLSFETVVTSDLNPNAKDFKPKDRPIDDDKISLIENFQGLSLENSKPKNTVNDDKILIELEKQLAKQLLREETSGISRLVWKEESASRNEMWKPYAAEEKEHQKKLVNLLNSNPGQFKECRICVEYHKCFAIVIGKVEREKIKIPTRKFRGHALDGDIAVVEIIEVSPHEPGSYGKVVGVLHRFLKLRYNTLPCTMDEYDGRLLVPLDKRYPKMIWWARDSDLEKRRNKHKVVGIYQFKSQGKMDFVRFEYTSNAERNNKIFIAVILNWGPTFRFPICVVVNSISPQELEFNSLDKLNFFYGFENISLRNSGLDQLFPENWKVPSDEYQRRVNFTEKMVFTIDPTTSEDLDDAFSILKSQDDRLYHVDIHIADVDYFIKQGTEYDSLIASRGTSNYPFCNNPFHMISKRFSCNLCSLLPKRDRLTISVSLVVDQIGDIIEKSITKSIIRSRRRFSYIEFEKLLDSTHSLSADGFSFKNEFMLVAKWILSLATCIHRRRMADAKLIHPPRRDVFEAPKSHFIVEELMVLANSVVAEWLLCRYPDITPLRCQPPPLVEDIQQLQSLETEYGIRKNNSYATDLSIDLWSNQLTEGQFNFTFLVSDWLALIQMLKCGDFSSAKSYASSEILFPTISQLHPGYRKIQKLSKYACSGLISKSSQQHFSLNLPAYVHFTSPIRRYMDIVVHRMLKAALEKKKHFPYNLDDIASICEQSNQLSTHSRHYEEQSSMIHAATQIIKDPLCALGVIVDITESDMVLDFPLMGNMELPEQRIRLSLLKPSTLPKFTSSPLSLLLMWQDLLFSDKFSSEISDVDKRVIQIETESYINRIPFELWQRLWLAVSNKDDDEVEECITESKLLMAKRQLEPLSSENICLFKACYKLGTVVKTQFITKKAKGIIQPVLQLFSLTPKLDICLEHRRDPVRCFSKIADKDVYSLKIPTSIPQYKKVWGGLVSMEGAHAAVEENEGFTLYDIKVTWNSVGGSIIGSFTPSNEFVNMGIKFENRDLACVRCDPFQLTESNTSQFNSQRVWVGHCIVKFDYHQRNKKNPEVLLQLNNSAYKIFEEMLQAPKYCTIECIKKSNPCQRMEIAVSSVHISTDFIKNLCTGSSLMESSNQLYKKVINNSHFLPFKNNEEQKAIVKQALQKPFSIIQGPPGTGKSFTGAHLAYLFSLMNEKMKISPKVLYCGPSNKCVDVVVEKLKNIVDKKYILRVYSSQVEKLEFPWPSEKIILKKRNPRKTVKTGVNVTDLALHHRIRNESANSFAKQILKMEQSYQNDPNYKINLDKYSSLIKKAIQYEIRQCRIVLCTCSTAGRDIIAENDDLNVHQCIVDEAGMCQEPEWLVPLVATKPKQVVIIGDHKQLRPIITEPISRRLGLERSIMERYSGSAMMMKTQYRMHKSICKFPSQKFYDGKLKTAKEVKERKNNTNIRWPEDHSIPLVFCHVEGKEEVLTVATDESGEQSRNNMDEVEHAVRIAHCLVVRHKIQESSIVIMTQYRAQKIVLEEGLVKRSHGGIAVRTVVQSQGDEWDYVIFSTVRSLPQCEIEEMPGIGWQRRHLGFITDEHQINVALTRARLGFCIIGNKHLLSINEIWKDLLQEYSSLGKVIPATKFIV